jgi:hypothetical protein
MADHALLSDLYHEAFRRFGTAYLWSKAPVSPVTPDGAAAVARTLAREGDREAWMLARRIQALCLEMAKMENAGRGADANPDQNPSAPRQ